MGEKKEIKMSLWSFFVLMAGVVMLIAGIVIACFAIIDKQNATPTVSGTQQTSGVNDSIAGTKENSYASNNKTEENATNKNNTNKDEIVMQKNETSANTNHNTTNENNTSGNTSNNSSENSNTTPAYNPSNTTSSNSGKVDLKQYLLYTPGNGGRMESNDLDYNLVLESKINPNKNVNSVNNYASTMKWKTYDNLEYSIKYPSDWNVEMPTNGIEQIRITGKAIGKQALENGENGDKVVESDMAIIVYKTITCTQEEINRMNFTDALGYDATETGGAYWTQVYLEGQGCRGSDNFTFEDNGDGTFKLIKVRILNSNSSITTYKTLNIENYILGEVRIK